MPSSVTQQILGDVFGRQIDDVFEEGLVDADDSTDFQVKLESLYAKWSNIECSSSADMSGFIEWFSANKVDVIVSSMLRAVREDCGLGNPPNIFTTNASESVNAMLKNRMDYKKSELPIFVEKLKEICNEQDKEVERAILCRGKYRFREEYKFLEVSESKWFTMNSTQRKQHLTKVHSLCVSGSSNNSSACDGNIGGDLLVEAESAAQELHLPLACVQGIWRKAAELLSKKNAVVTAPGHDDDNVKMVLSYSSKTPHTVTPTKLGYACDNNCANWKSIGICSHTVAVAQVNGNLPVCFLTEEKKEAAKCHTTIDYKYATWSR